MPEMRYRKGNDGAWELWAGEFVTDDPAQGSASFILGLGDSEQSARADAVKELERLEAILQSPSDLEVHHACD